MSLTLDHINRLDNNKVAFFNFKKLNGKYLLTNDIGEHIFLEFCDFESYLLGSLKNSNLLKYNEMQKKGFIRDNLEIASLIEKYAKKKQFLTQGPSLHIVVVTLKCDHRCVYCQTSSKSLQDSHLDMTTDVARKVVDKIFEAPAKAITIEFQGGEPLLNFETVKFIIQYANQKKKANPKKVLFALVTNLASMDQAKFEFLRKNKVSICTSLDGPEALHRKNRIYAGKKNIYPFIKSWIKTMRSAHSLKTYPHKTQALLTVSRSSLAYPKKIVDTYLSCGFEAIHLRHLSPLGLAKDTWKKIGYTAEEFVDFYKKAIDYILEINKKGTFFIERTTSIFLHKILTETDPNYLDMRSPCGAASGQLAYNYNGDIYVCDEARMLSRMGDDSFKIGDVDTPYEKLMHSDVCKSLYSASLLENLPGCASCVYSPYCGVCPILNYAENGDIFGRQPHNFKSKINRMQLDYIFPKIEDESIKQIFKRWNSAEGGVGL